MAHDLPELPNAPKWHGIIMCEVCGTPTDQNNRCTNRLCLPCHALHCTSGGATSPGHNRIPAFDTCTFSIEQGVWMVRWQGSVLRPTFNSRGAAQAFIDGLHAGRKPS